MPGFVTHVVPRPVRRRGRRRGAGAAARRDLRRGVRARSPAARASSCSPTGTPTAELAPIPSLLLTGAVHHHLVREKTRTQVGLLVEAGDVREVHHVALLDRLRRRRGQPLPRDGVASRTSPARATTSRSSPRRPSRNLIKALGKGVLKVMSKMGVSTVASYTGAQIFEAVGLSPGRWSTSTSPAPPPSSAASGSTRSPRRSPAGTPRRTRADGIAPAHRELRDRRRVPVAPRGRAAPVRPRDRVPAAALHPHRPLRHLQAVHRSASTSSPSG